MPYYVPIINFYHLEGFFFSSNLVIIQQLFDKHLCPEYAGSILAYPFLRGYLKGRHRNLNPQSLSRLWLGNGVLMVRGEVRSLSKHRGCITVWGAHWLCMAVPTLRGFMVEEAKTRTFAKVRFSVNSLLILSRVQSPGLWKTPFVLTTAGIFPSLTGFGHFWCDSPQ